jgi:ribosomal protein S12 methylthiotransferase
LATPPFSAYIKISEGCDYPCTFCIIPKIRGHYRSRTEDSVVAEAESLAGQGVREILLIAQDTTRYGVDHGKRNGLASLLGQLSRVDGIEWLRFLYAYPTTLNESILEAINDYPEICRYIDIPLQHASDSVLKAMKRPGTRASNTKMIERMRTVVPGVAIRSSFIVGFPGESEDDFAQLLDFCGEVELDHLGVFTYSHEEGTEAFSREDTIPEEEKQRRRGELMEQQAAISLRKNSAFVGRKVRVLIEGPSPQSELVLGGRTERQAPEIDGTVLVTDGWAESGTFAKVEITEAHPYDLVGTVVEPENPTG